MRLATIELCKDWLEFSAGHFTILSPTTREPLHGHNYQIYCALTMIVGELGMTFDYRFYKEKIRNICKEINLFFLLPANSPYLNIEEAGDYYNVYFAEEKMPFLKKDIKILPVVNITVEELSNWFLQRLIADEKELEEHALQKIEVKVYSTPSQCGSSKWEKS